MIFFYVFRSQSLVYIQHLNQIFDKIIFFHHKAFLKNHNYFLEFFVINIIIFNGNKFIIKPREDKNKKVQI